MRYLTKEWYTLCQNTFLHFGLRVHRGAAEYSDELYSRLYRRKEREFIKLQREIYNTDPRFMLEEDGETFIPVDQFLSGESICEEDKMIYHMTIEEKERIHKLIEEFDNRLPFDENECKKEFSAQNQNEIMMAVEYKLPHELLNQIADIRVFALGYCTKDVLSELKKLSKENEEKVNQVLNEYTEAQNNENIPSEIHKNFHFHDCTVNKINLDNNITVYLDTQGGFTEFNKITFIAPEIMKQDGNIVGSYWVYEELYRTETGYEAHILLSGEDMIDLIIKCEDVLIEKV